MQVTAPLQTPTRRRAVVCDADTVSSRLVARTLTASGFDSAVCHTAADCERAVAEQRPDLVVLALLLPDSDGLVLLRRLRAQRPQPAQSPSLLMVSAIRAADWALEAGADAFLHKPIPPHQLASVACALVDAQAS